MTNIFIPRQATASAIWRLTEYNTVVWSLSEYCFITYDAILGTNETTAFLQTPLLLKLIIAPIKPINAQHKTKL
jgi:hypothetical protein